MEQESSKVRVVVVDDQNISRGFFEMYVRAAAKYELAAGLRTARESVEYVDNHDVDLLIMDVMMQDGIDGLTAAEKIKKNHPGIKIILTTSTSETSWEEKAEPPASRASGTRNMTSMAFMEIMDRTMAGESVYPSDAPNVPFGKVTRADLTERELEILRELTASLTNEEIAEKLMISVNTVKRHIQNIMEKTGFGSRLELAANAKLLGLVVSDKERLNGD